MLIGVGACRDLEKEASQKQRDARPALDKVKLAEETVEAADDQVRRAQEYAQNADEELKAAVEQLRCAHCLALPWMRSLPCTALDALAMPHLKWWCEKTGSCRGLFMRV